MKNKRLENLKLTKPPPSLYQIFTAISKTLIKCGVCLFRHSLLRLAIMYPEQGVTRGS